MLFFLCSGFLFAHSLEKAERLGRMLLGRLIWILVPLMAITIVFYGFQAVYGLVVHEPTYFAQFGLWDWVQSATLFSFILGVPDAIYGVTWFLFPLIVFQLLATLGYYLVSRRPVRLCLMMNILCVVVYGSIRLLPGLFGILSYLQYLPVLLVGSVLYWYQRERFSRRHTCLQLAFPAVIFMALCRRCSPGCFDVPESIPLQFFWGTAIFVIAMLLEGQRPLAVPRVIQRFAQFSYGVYLCQMTFGALALDAALRVWHRIPLGLAVLFSFVFTLLLAAAFHQWIEKPVAFVLQYRRKTVRQQ